MRKGTIWGQMIQPFIMPSLLFLLHNSKSSATFGISTLILFWGRGRDGVQGSLTHTYCGPLVAVVNVENLAIEGDIDAEIEVLPVPEVTQVILG